MINIRDKIEDKIKQNERKNMDSEIMEMKLILKQMLLRLCAMERVRKEH